MRAILAGLDQDRTASAILDQRDPAQDERAHDPLAEFSFRDDDAAQALGGNEKRFDLGLCTRVNERGAARQLSDFGEELARSFFDDWDHMSQTVPGLMATVPAMTTNMPGVGSPVTNNDSPGA